MTHLNSFSYCSLPFYFIICFDGGQGQRPINLQMSLKDSTWHVWSWSQHVPLILSPSFLLPVFRTDAHFSVSSIARHYILMYPFRTLSEQEGKQISYIKAYI